MSFRACWILLALRPSFRHAPASSATEPLLLCGYLRRPRTSGLRVEGKDFNGISMGINGFRMFFIGFRCVRKAIVICCAAVLVDISSTARQSSVQWQRPS